MGPLLVQSAKGAGSDRLGGGERHCSAAQLPFRGPAPVTCTSGVGVGRSPGAAQRRGEGRKQGAAAHSRPKTGRKGCERERDTPP